VAAQPIHGAIVGKLPSVAKRKLSLAPAPRFPSKGAQSHRTPNRGCREKCLSSGGHRLFSQPGASKG
jgi:hypothetical protein